jgi:hypothetical protein
LFFYDGPKQQVMRLSFDFSVSQVAAQDLICSPLAADTALYCAHVTGISQVNLNDGKTRLLQAVPQGTITTLAVGTPGLMWVTDVGQERLELSLLPMLSSPPKQ